MVTATGLEPTRLGLEITESVLTDDVESSLKTLRALKILGVQVLLDDFGTGYLVAQLPDAFPDRRREGGQVLRRPPRRQA